MTTNTLIEAVAKQTGKTTEEVAIARGQLISHRYGCDLPMTSDHDLLIATQAAMTQQRIEGDRY